MISMKKCLSTIFVMLFVISCSDNEIANKAPTFGYHIDKIVRVNEGDTSIGTFQAIDVDGDEINYAISNTDMGITQDGEVTFNIVPDFDLNLMSKNQTLSNLTSKILTQINLVLDSYKPELVFVHGDTTTTAFASIASFYNQIKICHIEAGLRTFNKYSPFPEEINRTIY